MLAVETVAEPAAERGSEHEADRAAGHGADRRAAAEADRLFLRGDARLAFVGAMLRPREARRREQAPDQQDNEFLLHGSLLKRNVGGHGAIAANRADARVINCGRTLPQS